MYSNLFKAKVYNIMH